MQKGDFLQIVGAGGGTEYAPVAGMLQSGYSFAGYYNSALNAGLDATCVILNARLVDLRSTADVPTRPHVSDFNEFVEDIVLKNYLSDQPPQAPRSDLYGKSIPLAAIPYDQIAVVYPVGQIGKMMQAVQRESKKLPSFLDFDDKSLVLKVLRTKLW